jgi:hypothetical protein
VTPGADAVSAPDEPELLLPHAASSRPVAARIATGATPSLRDLFM